MNVGIIVNCMYYTFRKHFWSLHVALDVKMLNIFCSCITEKTFLNFFGGSVVCDRRVSSGRINYCSRIVNYSKLFSIDFDSFDCTTTHDVFFDETTELCDY